LLLSARLLQIDQASLYALVGHGSERCRISVDRKHAIPHLRQQTRVAATTTRQIQHSAGRDERRKTFNPSRGLSNTMRHQL
jgi:hypothetical protein